MPWCALGELRSAHALAAKRNKQITRTPPSKLTKGNYAALRAESHICNAHTAEKRVRLLITQLKSKGRWWQRYCRDEPLPWLRVQVGPPPWLRVQGDLPQGFVYKSLERDFLPQGCQPWPKVRSSHTY